MKSDKELINDMKMCPLCYKEDGKYPLLNAQLHQKPHCLHYKEMKELSTHYTWAPTKGHPDWELHKRLIKIYEN